ncbi:hypothetical protein AAG570_000969 [Ranatra chinensis]|uniref:Reverse transcriptase domain-containing protein n=1 Tax=Ranatra chinensis TaxID=642074 RepID=A0ABD0YAH4_9HEMI
MVVATCAVLAAPDRRASRRRLPVWHYREIAQSQAEENRKGDRVVPCNCVATTVSGPTPLSGEIRLSLRELFGRDRTVVAHVMDWASSEYVAILRTDALKRVKGKIRTNGIRELITRANVRECFGEVFHREGEALSATGQVRHEIVIPDNRVVYVKPRRYHQFLTEIIGEEVKNLQGIIRNLGEGNMIRIPFGLKDAPSTFQRLMDEFLEGFNEDAIQIYMDVIIVFSRTEQGHGKHLEQLLQRFKEFGLKESDEKSPFFNPSVHFMVRMDELRHERSSTRPLRLLASPLAALADSPWLTEAIATHHPMTHQNPTTGKMPQKRMTVFDVAVGRPMSLRMFDRIHLHRIWFETVDLPSLVPLVQGRACVLQMSRAPARPALRPLPTLSSVLSSSGEIVAAEAEEVAVSSDPLVVLPDGPAFARLFSSPNFCPTSTPGNCFLLHRFLSGRLQRTRFRPVWGHVLATYQVIPSGGLP